jgi:AcrR family transcriptional regulator
MLDLGNVHPVGILQAQILEILRCVIGDDRPRPTPKLPSSFCGMSGILTRRPSLFRSDKPGKLFTLNKGSEVRFVRMGIGAIQPPRPFQSEYKVRSLLQAFLRSRTLVGMGVDRAGDLVLTVLDFRVYYIKQMARPAKFTEVEILDAAATLVAGGGPASATVTAIAAAIGAPNGSIYHRFKTRDELLGRLWLGKAAVFQNNFVNALKLRDPHQVGLAAALSLARTARADFAGARIMLLHRREDFLGDGWPAEMQIEANRLGRQVTDALADITMRLFGNRTAASRQAAAFAVLDVPFAAVRRHVAAGEVPPLQADKLIEIAFNATIQHGQRTSIT